MNDRWVDTMGALARDQEAPSVEPPQRDAMIEEALRRASAQPKSNVPPRDRALGALGFGLAGLLGAAAAATAWIALSDDEAEEGPTATVTELELPSGDRLIATDGARFRVARDQGRREIELRSGAMLFDVAPLEAGESFVVRSPGLDVVVQGTVFSVEVRPDGEATPVVRVFEGEVEARLSRREIRVDEPLEAPGDSGLQIRVGMELGPDGRVRPLREGPLHDAGESAAAARTQLADSLVRREEPHAIPEQSPAEQSPSEQSPSEQSPSEQSPSEQSPSEQSPSEQSPSEESAPTRGQRDLEASRPAEEPEAAPSAPAQPTAHSAPAVRPRDHTVASPELPTRDDQALESPEQARRAIAEGRANDALAAAEDRIERAPSSAWEMVRADALRALRRFDEAAQSYERVARGGGGLGAQAGFVAASIHFRHRGAPQEAVRLLRTSGALEPDGALHERAAALHVRALIQSGQTGQARRAANDYLARYGNTEIGQWMRTVLVNREARTERR
ncbi:MAG: FecR domain-containing protein [Myxococcota bacterium]